MPKIKSKKEALEKLNNLPDAVVMRIAELSDNEKAYSYFSNGINFSLLKGMLNSL
ncbi:hypothetical protein [Tenacibaculum dicentrarchi]|uniref:hypothetical protein n=1 Tax=Tenacibaculum dicentrarchi TaxID=669041 RepID=UPI000CBA02E8|nr:hypothetical protein [Tenacibaculum dicentrarchi]SOU87840.1 hypothetical protein TDCHD05_70120 [Tenacibaculum dicentrarchi]